jgi:hypothetical protein
MSIFKANSYRLAYISESNYEMTFVKSERTE